MFLLPQTTCPKNADKKISNAQHQVKDDAPKKDRQPENCPKLSGLLFVQLMILPIYACISRAGHIADLDESSCKLAKILELLFVKD